MGKLRQNVLTVTQQNHAKALFYGLSKILKSIMMTM